MHLPKSVSKKFIAIAAIGFFVFFSLGVYGWRETLNRAGVHASWSQVFENSVELVAGEEAIVVEHRYDEHWALAAGKWGIKAVFAAAIFQSAILIFSRQWRQWRFRKAKGHSVYVGLGAQGEVLASIDLEKGLRVAVLDADEHHPSRGTLEGKGVFFQCGAPGDMQLLAKARLTTAKRVVVATGKDEENVDVAEKIAEILRGKDDFSGESVEILACMDSRDFCELLRARWQLLRKHSQKYSVKLVNFRAVAVRELVNRMTCEIAHLPEARKRGPRVLLMASEMTDDILAAAIVFMQISGDVRPQFWVNSADQNGKAHFLRRYPAIELVADVRFINENLHTIAKCEELAGLKLDAAVICSEQEIDALAIAERLLRSARFEVAGVKVLLNKPRRLELAGDELRLEILSLAKEGLESPELCDTDTEKKARKNHEAYLKGLSEEAKKTKPAAKDWMFLAEQFKESNRLAALHSEIKKIIYKSLSPEEKNVGLEILARSEHQRWMADRIINDWCVGSRDDERRIHPGIRPYDELDEATKQYDRDQVRHALGL